MNKLAKEFIEERLIPFILRENGNGFAMDAIEGIFRDETEYFDGIIHKRPSCNTAACIGGSVRILTEPEEDYGIRSLVARILDISPIEAEGLCYNWEPPHDTYKRDVCRWPNDYIHRFAKAKTPMGKAKVAVDLLREVMRTDGKCLHPESEK